jgi:hypothetical protein
MANPSDETCTADTWTAVVTAVTSCTLSALDNNHYQVAIRENPSVAPTSASDGEFFGGQAEIHHYPAFDVYVLCVGATGTVRVYA